MAINPPGSTTTYDAVRDWALDAAGFGTASPNPCPVDPDVVNTILLNALQQMHTQVWMDELYQQTWTFTIPATFEQVGGASPLTLDAIFNPRWQVLERIVRTRDHQAVYQCTNWPLLGDADETTTPGRLEWAKWGDQFALWPPSTQDEDYTVYGYRELNRSIFTVGAGDLITWQIVDLPNEYIEVYQKIVLGMVLFACGDLQSYQGWLQLAADELNQIKNAPIKSRTSDSGAELIMGGGRPSYYTPPGDVLVVQLPIG